MEVISEFLDGLFGIFSFSSNYENILYGGLPSAVYILGLLTALGVCYWFWSKAIFIDKGRLKLKATTRRGLYKELWQSNLVGKIELIFIVLIGLSLTFLAGRNTIQTTRAYRTFSRPVASQVNGTISDFSITVGSGKSNYGYVNAIFTEENGDVHLVHIVNGNKRLARQIENGSSSYSAQVSLDKDGHILSIDRFVGE